MSEKKELVFIDGYDDREYTLENFVERNLDGNDYGMGQIEATQAATEKTVRAFTNLLRALAEKNLLSIEDIENIIKSV
jgi:hypothetical protein